MPEKFGKGLVKQLNLSELLSRVLSAAEPDDLDVDVVRESKLGVNELIGEIRARIEELVDNFRSYSEKIVESGAGQTGTSLPSLKGSWLSILLKDEFALEIQANVEKDIIRMIHEEEN
jgi:hypothetical protein